jgi:hypothetical protein
MDNLGVISSLEHIAVPAGPHVKEFDAAQKAKKAAERIAKQTPTLLTPVKQSEVTGSIAANSVTGNIAPNSVNEFVAAFAEITANLEGATDALVQDVKQKLSDILPLLGKMQSLLSKKGVNHHLVIAARKQGHKIPWWTEWYESYRSGLSGALSMRTVNHHLATLEGRTPKRKEMKMHLNKAACNALIEGNHNAVEIVAAVEAGRDATAEIAQFKKVMDAKRLDDILQAHEQEPDYKSILIKVLQTVEAMKSSLPVDFVKTLNEVTKTCKPTPIESSTRKRNSKTIRDGLPLAAGSPARSGTNLLAAATSTALTASPVPQPAREPGEQPNEQNADPVAADPYDLTDNDDEGQTFQIYSPTPGAIPTTKIGDKSEPTAHGFFYEFIRDEKPYAVRDMNNPHIGIMCKFKSKTEAQRYIDDREREAAVVKLSLWVGD